MSKKNEGNESNSSQETIEMDPNDVENPDEENDEELSPEDNEDNDDSDPNAEEDDSDEEDSDDEGEYEIVLEGDSGLSDKELKTQKFHDRMNERNKQTSMAKESEGKANAELDAKNKENLLLRQLLDKQQGNDAPSGPPNPDNYDGGAFDNKYIADITAFHANQANINATKNIMVAREQDEQRKKVDEKKRVTEKFYESHYQRATDLDKKLKKKDYDEKEKVALKVFGDAKSDFIVETFDNSEMIFYKLGQDEAKARYFSNLLDTSPGRALKEMGVFESKIKKVKRKINKTPDPETNARGGFKKSNKGKRGPQDATFT
jgi:hypothetical protein